MEPDPKHWFRCGICRLYYPWRFVADVFGSPCFMCMRLVMWRAPLFAGRYSWARFKSGLSIKLHLWSCRLIAGEYER